MLFSHDTRSVECHFVGAVRDVLLIDRARYIREFEAALLSDASTVSGRATVHAATSALMRVDPRRPDHHVTAFLENIFGAANFRQSIELVDASLPVKDRYVLLALSAALADVRVALRRHPLARFTRRSTADRLAMDEAVRRQAAGDSLGAPATAARPASPRRVDTPPVVE